MPGSSIYFLVSMESLCIVPPHHCATSMMLSCVTCTAVTSLGRRTYRFKSIISLSFEQKLKPLWGFSFEVLLGHLLKVLAYRELGCALSPSIRARPITTLAPAPQTMEVAR